MKIETNKLVNVDDILHKRILIVSEERRGYQKDVMLKEIKIIEIAPSGKWLKIQDMDGRKYWRGVESIQYVETLGISDKPYEAQV